MANGFDIQGLLSNPQFNQGVGLLAGVAGQPSSVQEAIAPGLLLGQQAQAGQQAALRNQVQRERLVQAQGRRQAQERLPGLLSSLGIPEEQIPAIGLLAQANPEGFAQAFTQGLLGQMFPQQRSETSLVRNVRALNDPTLSQEQRDIIEKNLTTDPNATKQLLDTVQLQLRAFQLDQAQREAAAEERDVATQRTKTTSALNSDLKDAVRLVALVDKLDGTELSPGTVGIEGRRAIAAGVAETKRFFGVDTSAAQRMISDFDEFQKLSRNFATKSTSRQFGDQSTNFQLQQLQETVPNVDITPDANRRIARGAVRTLLDAADAEGIVIPNRQRFEDFLARTEEGPISGRTPRALSQPSTSRAPAATTPRTTSSGLKFEIVP